MGPILQPPGAAGHPTLPPDGGPPIQSSQALPDKQGAGRVPRFRPPLAPPATRGQQDRSPPLHLCPARPTPLSVHLGAFPALWGILAQANAFPECQALLSHMQGPKHILEINEKLKKWLCWRLCYLSLGLSQCHCKTRTGDPSTSPRGTSQLTSAYVFSGLQLMKAKRKPLALSPNRHTGLGIICRSEDPCSDPPEQLRNQGQLQTHSNNPPSWYIFVFQSLS